MRCPGSLAVEQDLPDSSTEFADEGTAAHELASMCLTNMTDATAYLGRIIEVGTRKFTVDDEMAGHVQTYVDAIRQYADAQSRNLLMVEQRVEFSDAIGVPESFGTSDAIIITSDGEIQVHDLKYGRGVRVTADENEQLMLYALGAFSEYDLAYDIRRVRMVIHQPRLNHVSEWDCSVDDLLAFAEKAKGCAARTIQIIAAGPTTADFTPGEKQCTFCKAKATCPALTATVLDEFEAVPSPGANTKTDLLTHAMGQIDLIESWCKAVRAEIERRLFAGKDVPGFKLVEGRRGARKWINEASVEATLKGLNLKQEQIYDFSLISPATAEKLVKSAAIQKEDWSHIQTLITQAEGKASVAPISDKRPALQVTPVEDEFTSLV